MKTKIFRITYLYKYIDNRPFSLWVVQAGPKHHRMTRYFKAWDDAAEYVASGKCDQELRRINMSLTKW